MQEAAELQWQEDQAQKAAEAKAATGEYRLRGPKMEGETAEGRTEDGKTIEAKKWKIKTEADLAAEDNKAFAQRGPGSTSDFIADMEAKNRQANLDLAKLQSERSTMDTADDREAKRIIAGAAKMASGGSIPGGGHGDTVPAMLTPGEFVVNAQQAQKHMATLNAINNGDSQLLHLGGMVLENVFSPVIPSPAGARRMADGGVVSSFNNTFNVGGGNYQNMMKEIGSYLSKQWEYPYGGTGRRAVI
jgi:hypothetical protein